MLRNNLFTLLIVSMATLLISPPSTNAAPLVGDDDSGSDVTAPAAWRREGYDDLYDYLDGYNSYEGTGEDVNDNEEEEDRSKADMQKRYDQSTLTLMKLKNKQRQLMDHFQRQLMYRRSSPDSPSSKKISISNKEEEGAKERSPRGNRNHDNTNEEDEKILAILNFLMSSQLRRQN